jgi:hypothetical protein
MYEPTTLKAGAIEIEALVTEEGRNGTENQANQTDSNT